MWMGSTCPWGQLGPGAVLKFEGLGGRPYRFWFKRSYPRSCPPCGHFLSPSTMRIEFHSHLRVGLCEPLSISDRGRVVRRRNTTGGENVNEIHITNTVTDTVSQAAGGDRCGTPLAGSGGTAGEQGDSQIRSGQGTVEINSGDSVCSGRRILCLDGVNNTRANYEWHSLIHVKKILKYKTGNTGDKPIRKKTGMCSSNRHIFAP